MGDLDAYSIHDLGQSNVLTAITQRMVLPTFLEWAREAFLPIGRHGVCNSCPDVQFWQAVPTQGVAAWQCKRHS